MSAIQIGAPGDGKTMEAMKKHLPPAADVSLLAVGTGILTIVYLTTLLPGVGYHGDTAKFQFVGKVLGTPHATGYPTYLLLNHAFLKIFPFGSDAYRANLLSALLAAAACGVVFLLIRRMGVGRWIALASMLTLGLTPALWSQAVVAEVYALNALFLGLVLHQFTAWSLTGRRRNLWAGIALNSLSFGNHMTMITILPALVVLVLMTDRRVFRDGRTWAWALGWIALGAGQYGYLLWRYHDPGTVFMEVMVPNLRALWWVVLGAQFRGRMFALPFREVLTVRIPLVAGFLRTEMGILLVFALGGAAFHLRRREVVFLLTALAGNIVFTLNYEIDDIEVYIIPAVLIAVVLMALGLERVRSLLGTRGRLVAPVVFAAPLVLLVANFGSVDRSGDTEAARFAEGILETADSDALLMGFGYHELYYLSYYLIGEGMQSARNIYAVHHPRPEEFLEYFRNDIPITLIDQRRNTPSGLPAFVKEGPLLDALIAGGLRARRVGEGLWRIDPLSAAGSD